MVKESLPVGPFVALYCRLSPRPDGTYEGVDLQEQWGREYAARHWPDLSVVVFADAGLSAAKEDVHRPAYERLRAAVAAGRVAHLWTVEQSRLERREVGWFVLAAELDAAGITEIHTNRDGIVRVMDDVAGIKAVLSAGEVRKLTRRVNDRLAELAAEGRPSGTRPFGYARGLDEDGKKTYVVVPDQAAIVRETADRVLSGWSLTRIATDLTSRGVLGTFGGKITATSLKSMLTNPAVAGYRVHQGRVVGRGIWTPILDDDTWHAIKDRLSAPRPVIRADGETYLVTGMGRTAPRRYLLTGGIAHCGVCDAPLVGSLKQRRNRKGVLLQVLPYYNCHPRAGGRGCLGIMADPMESYVVDRLMDELDKPAFRDALTADQYAAQRDRITTALRRVEGKRTQLAAEWARSDDDVNADEWRIARQQLAERERALRMELAAVPPPVAEVDLDAIRADWGSMNLDERREIISKFIRKVVVKRSAPGARAFNEERIGLDGIVWRTTA